MRRLFDTDPVAVAYLRERGVWLPHLTHAENMARCAEARGRWCRLGADPGKQWARDLVARYRSGAAVSVYAVRLAMAALDMAEEVIVVRPAKPVSRPDHMERAAGDVEVEL